ncbi:hypothetical protein [Absiella sp. AM29-15]|jgi:hypothetical protein|uniref:hypothetical protein n=1 Tax=Absiella sp. AM29-15 TaxID=2292278 RepID=UPI000E3FEBBA|nr:hypothetical protein [Absiella sp. AM29-15]RGC52334.1 hypothetical protein DW761_07110 [Absiella sp. AM29-15]
MIFLEPRIKQALLDMDFVGKYEKLYMRFNDDRAEMNGRLENIDIDIVMKILNELGYEAKFDRKEKFFKIKENKHGKYTYGAHIILDVGIVDMIWIVRENKKLILASPLAVYSRMLIDVDYRTKSPVIGSYEDLKEILEIEFEMFDEFRSILFEQE